MIANEQYQRLSNPQNNVKIMAAWEGFLSGHAPQANALRCLIDDSWRRCLAVQVDPARRQALPPVNEATLNSLQHQHCELLSAGKQVMAMAKDFLAETETIMILSDPNGMILGVEGDPRALGAAEDIHLIAGSSWSELICGTVRLDTRSGRVTVDGNPIKLTSHEYRLLSYLMHHTGRVVSRTELVEHLYDQDFDRDSNTIEVFVGRIRKKLGVDVIQTVRGLGYLLSPSDAR